MGVPHRTDPSQAAQVAGGAVPSPTAAGGSGDEGFSLVEIIVAMTLFAVVATVAAGVLLKVGGVNRDAVRRTTATNLAAEQIESIRNSSATDIPDGGITRQVTRGTTTYTIKQTANYLSSGSDVSICNGSGNTLAYKLVTVTVRWPGMGSTAAVRADTLKSLGVGSSVLDATKGTLALSVVGARARPTANVTVTLTPGNIVRTTGEDGCAVYAGLAPGAYTATLNMPGFVGQTNAQVVTVTSLGVTAGTVVRGTALYTDARTLELLPEAPSGYPLAAGLRFFYGSTYLTPRIVPTCVEQPTGQACLTTSNTFRNVFPTTYDAWLGTCSEGYQARRTLDVASSADPLTLATAWLDARALRLGQPVSDVQLYAVHAPETVNATDVGCATGASYALPLTGSSGGSSVGSKVALPPGTWRIQTTAAWTATPPTGSVTVTLVAGAAGSADVVVP